MAGVDVDTLTMEQYLALSRENQAPGVVKPEIGGNVYLKSKSQFMRELREDTFSGNKDEDAHDHIDRVLSMRWVDRLAPGTINTWDLLKKAFIQRYCPPSMTAKQLEDIHNFKQKGDESLYQAWEQYMTYYTSTLLMTSIVIKRNIGSSSSNDGLAALVNKLDNLGRDMKKLKKSVHAIQVGCQNCEGPHLDKDCPLNEEVKQVEEVRYGEFRRTMPFDGNNRGRQTLAETVKKYIEATSMRQETETKTNNNEDCKAIFTNDGAPLYTPFYYSLEEIEYFSTNSGFSDDDELKNVTSIPDEDLKQTSPKQTTTHYIEPYVPPIPFPSRLEQHAEEALIHKTIESLKKIKSNRPFLKEIRQSNEYPKFMKDLVANKPLTMENEDIRINRRCSALLLNQLPPKEKDTGSFILPCSIGRLDFNNALADLGASISIMPFSMYKRLGIGKLETIKMNIELADNSKCIPKGIVRNLLIKIDKFILPVDFIILDVLEDYRMPVILGRPLLTTAHAKIDVFKRSISLEAGNEKVIFKLKSDLPDMKNESVLMIQSNIITEENELMNIESDLLTYNTNTCESCHILAIDTDLFTYEVVTQETYEEIAHKCCLTTQDVIGEKTNPILRKRKSHWCAPIYRQNNRIQEVWASCNPLNEGCDGGSLRNNEIRCYWESENDNNCVSIECNDLSLNDWLKIKYGEVDETMKKKILTEHWRKRFGIDYDDIDDFYDPDQCGESKNNEIRERIIHGFMDLDEAEYNKRRCRLLGMPYIEPLPIIIEQVKITRYSLGPGEVYTKLEVSNTKELPRTRHNVATIRSNIMEEDPETRRQLSRLARLIIMGNLAEFVAVTGELGDKELARRR
ncbi:putative reverse transcriptase domain-containing protein, partial [Tanacetum coccineum]